MTLLSFPRVSDAREIVGLLGARDSFKCARRGILYYAQPADLFAWRCVTARGSCAREIEDRL
jgi:hypothetical protein